MIVLIDNGHGADTKGKQSPDGRLREYKYAREIAARVVNALKLRGTDARLLTPEEKDVTISARVRRANNICKQYGASNVLLVSIHNNAAASDGKWMKAQGFQSYVALNASAKSKKLAAYFWENAIDLGLQGNRSVPRERYIAQNLGICRDTLCPAVLTENLYQDNKADVEYLLSPTGKDTIVQLHIDSITDYINSL